MSLMHIILTASTADKILSRLGPDFVIRIKGDAKAQTGALMGVLQIAKNFVQRGIVGPEEAYATVLKVTAAKCGLTEGDAEHYMGVTLQALVEEFAPKDEAANAAIGAEA